MYRQQHLHEEVSVVDHVEVLHLKDHNFHALLKVHLDLLLHKTSVHEVDLVVDDLVDSAEVEEGTEEVSVVDHEEDFLVDAEDLVVVEGDEVAVEAEREVNISITQSLYTNQMLLLSKKKQKLKLKKYQ